MNRQVPFEPESVCESCGALGAFDFMGDLLCHPCAFPGDSNEFERKTITMTTEADRQTELLKDRRDYRQSLIHRRNELDGKIAKVESEIRKIQESAR